MLETGCNYARNQILNVLDLVLRTRQFQVQDREIMRAALTIYRSGTADFADAVIGHGNRTAGCEMFIMIPRKWMRPERKNGKMGTKTAAKTGTGQKRGQTTIS